MRSYVKMSDYPDSYEAAFWRRPFAIEAWMKSKGASEVFVIDSDVMTFADYSKEVVPLLSDGCGATLITRMKQENFVWASSLHFSYWTRDVLEDFINFCIGAYTDVAIRGKLETKYQWHINNKKPGGISEMTLLYLWQQKTNGRVTNLAQVLDGVVADSCITDSANYFEDEYELKSTFKRFVFKKGLPYGFNRILNKEVRFLCVHCQGKSKRMMACLQKRRNRFYRQFCYFDQYREWARSALRLCRSRVLARIN